ncbi:MAG: ABC transporter substrate-binding protein [Succinivibrio sp.]|nr:ABC transporter substrate-binding protein [Succinivibrio sp.]
MFLRSLAGAMLGLLLISSAFAAEENTNPYVLANNVAERTFAELQKNADKLEDLNYCRALINRELMPHIDVKYAAYKVMGSALKNISKEDREAFCVAFGKYLEKTLTETLHKYTNQELIKSPVSEPDKDASIVSVKVGIQKPGEAVVALILKCRKNTKTGEWKAFDLIAENVSVLDAKAAEISPIINKDGVQAAIEALNKNVQQL